MFFLIFLVIRWRHKNLIYPNQMKIKPFYFLANKVLHNRGLLLKLKGKQMGLFI